MRRRGIRGCSRRSSTAAAREPSREEVVAELVLFIRETVRELGERRASGFLKKFYAWYLGRGRFPRPFKQELVVLDSTEEVERRLIAAAPGSLELIERLEAEVPSGEDVTLELPISIYGGWLTASLDVVERCDPVSAVATPSPTKTDPLT